MIFLNKNHYQNNLVLVLAFRLVGSFLMLVISYFMPKFFDIASFGYYVLAIQLLTVTTSLANKGLPQVIIRDALKHVQDGNERIWFSTINISSLKRSLYITLFGIIIGMIFDFYMNDDGFKIVLLSLVTLPFFVLNTNISSFLAGIKKPWISGLLENILANLSVLAILFFLKYAESVSIYVSVIVLFISQLIVSISFYIIYLRNTKISVNQVFGSNKLNSNFFIITITSQILPMVIPLIIMYQLNDEMLGYYNLLMKISVPIVFVYYTFQRVSTSFISESYRGGDHKGIRSIFRYATLGSVFPALFFAVCIYIFRYEIYNFWNITNLEVELLLLFILLGLLVNSATSIVSPLLTMCGRELFVARTNIVATAITIFAGFYLIGKIGTIGIGWTYLISTVILNFPKFIKSLKVIK